LKKSVKDTKQGKKGKIKVIVTEKCLYFFFVERVLEELQSRTDIYNIIYLFIVYL